MRLMEISEMASSEEFPLLDYAVVGQLIALAEAGLIDLVGTHDEAENAMKFARSYHKNKGQLFAPRCDGIQGDLGEMRQDFLKRHSKTRDFYHRLWRDTGEPSKNHFLYACYGYSGDSARLAAWLGDKMMGKNLDYFGV